MGGLGRNKTARQQKSTETTTMRRSDGVRFQANVFLLFVFFHSFYFSKKRNMSGLCNFSRGQNNCLKHDDLAKTKKKNERKKDLSPHFDAVQGDLFVLHIPLRR